MSPADLLEALGTIGDAPEGIEQLRQLILQLAVRGQLVSQYPNDEPASELVQHLHADLQSLRGSRKSRGGKKDGDDSREPPYDLPVSWCWVPANQVGIFIRGVTYKKADAQDRASDGTVPLLRANNIQTTVNFDKLVHVPIGLVKDLQFLEMHDLLICMSSGSHSLVGKTAPIRSIDQATFGAFCSVFRPCSHSIAPYLAYFFRSPLYRVGIAGDSRGIGINNLRSGDLQALLIPFPPLAEQRRIVAKVDELMALLDELEQARDERDAHRAAFRDSALSALQNAEDSEAVEAAWSRIATNLADCITGPADIAPLRQTILQLAVRGRLVPQDSTEGIAADLLSQITNLKSGRKPVRRTEVSVPEFGRTLPDSWCWASIGDIALSLPYGTSGKSSKSGEVPVLRMGNLQNGRINWDSLKFSSDNDEIDQYLLPPKAVLFNRTNSPALVGKTAIYCGERPAIYAGYLVQIKLPDCVCSEYINYLLNSSDARQWCSFAKSDAIGQSNISASKLACFPVPLPPLAEQHRIVAKVDVLMAICDELEQRLTEAKTHQSAFAAAAVHHLDLNASQNHEELVGG